MLRSALIYCRYTASKCPRSIISSARLVLLTISLVPFPSTAFAQFTASQPTEVNFGNGSFECGIVRLAPRDNDADPIFKIMPTVTFKDDDPNQLASMTVTHYSVAGKTYPRSEQYTDDSLVRTPHKLEIVWRGRWKRNRAVTMVGRLWNEEATKRWFYSETQSKNGYAEMQMLSVCHIAENERVSRSSRSIVNITRLRIPIAHVLPRLHASAHVHKIFVTINEIIEVTTPAKLSAGTPTIDTSSSSHLTPVNIKLSSH